MNHRAFVKVVAVLILLFLGLTEQDNPHLGSVVGGFIVIAIPALMLRGLCRVAADLRRIGRR